MDLPTEKGLFAPEGGWKEQTYYIVDVAWRSINPIHRRILYVGFINDARHPLLGSYTSLMCRKDDSPDWWPMGLYYLRPVCEIPEMKEQT